jgi:hypothetical protein
MTLKGWLICGACGALALAGLFMHRDTARAKADQVHVQKANEDQASAHSEAAAGAADVKPMQDQRAQIAEDAAANGTINTTLAADRARVASYRPRPVPDPGAPAVPAAEPVGEGMESPRELAKDQLIADLTTALAARDQQIADQAKLIATTTDYAQHEHAAYAQDDAAVNEMRQAVHTTYAHGLGLLYGPGQQAYGVIAEQDIARVRVVGELVQQVLPAMAGGKHQTLALIGAVIRF